MQAKLSDFKLKSVKHVAGHDGQGFTCNLYYKNKKVASIFDDGWGGGLQITWTDRSADKYVEINAKTFEGEPHTYKGTPTEKLFVEAVYNEVPPQSDGYSNDGKLYYYSIDC